MAVMLMDFTQSQKTHQLQGYTHKHTYNQLQVRPYHINNR